MERMLTVAELACEVGCSIQTLNSYYRFKLENPDSDVARALPDYTVEAAGHRTRYWTMADAEAIKLFRASIPQGRNGILGSVTQRYVKPKNGQSRKARPEARVTAFDHYDGYIKSIEAILANHHVEDAVIDQVRELLRSEYDWRVLSKIS